MMHKVFKFSCRSLPGKGNRSGIRIIYAFHEQGCKVEYIEIDYKGDKENEDRGRLIKYYGTPKIREAAEVYEARQEVSSSRFGTFTRVLHLLLIGDEGNFCEAGSGPSKLGLCHRNWDYSNAINGC